MKKKILLAVTLAVLVASCGSSGGGGGSSNSEPTPTPVTPTPAAPAPVIPDAPYVPFSQTDPHNVNAAKSSGLDGTGVSVGIIDSGFDAANPEFKDSLGVSRMNVDSSFTGNSGSHGSLVAEIIGGKQIGVAPNVKIEAIPAGVTCSDGKNECVDATRVMYDTLYNKGVRIFNQSFGSSNESILTASKNNCTISVGC